MKQVIITKGLPGSGKTRWARQQQTAHPGRYKLVCKDDLRTMLDNGRFSQNNEKFVLKVRDYLILTALEDGKHVIVADTNLAPVHENQIRALVKGLAEVKIQDFTHVPLETCIAQDLQRLNSVGKDVIMGMYHQYLKSPPPPDDPNLPQAIICDLDGTLALLNGRNPYNASICDQDLLNPVVARMIDGQNTILVSGREDTYKPQTEAFLEKYGIQYIHLLMRKAGD
ncbi:MAG: AAA family ATPase, partial [Microcystaceae cyanobacterium]